jgi:hypothetical protein
MKRKFFAVALMALGMMGLNAAPASAWVGAPPCFNLWSCFFPGHALSRYANVQISLPYNAFTPFTGGYTYNYGVTNGPCCGPVWGGMPTGGMPTGGMPWGGFPGGGMPWGGMGGMGGYCGPVCAGPMTMPGSYPMPMMMPAQGMPGPTVPMAMQPTYHYGVQPASYMPAYYPMSTGERFPMRNAFGN